MDFYVYLPKVGWKEHFGLGMDVRNLLYREGFELGGMGLDENWVYLLWKASEKVCGKKD